MHWKHNRLQRGLYNMSTWLEHGYQFQNMKHGLMSGHVTHERPCCDQTTTIISNWGARHPDRE